MSEPAREWRCGCCRPEAPREIVEERGRRGLPGEGHSVGAGGEGSRDKQEGSSLRWAGEASCGVSEEEG